VCGSVQECDKFLSTLRVEGHVIGYCILSRKGAPILSGSIFEDAPAATAAAAAPTSAAATAQQAAPSAAAFAALQPALAAYPVVPLSVTPLGGGAAPFSASGFTTCSMEPPLVSFLVAPGQGAGLAPGGALTLALPSAQCSISASVERLVDTAGGARVCVAGVQSVQQPSSHLHPTVQAGLKHLASSLPAPVSVATFQGIHGSAFALTATSARIGAPGALVFNVLKTSRQHLGLEGITGSRVALHMLGEAQQAVAQTFSKEADLTPEGFAASTGGLQLRTHPPVSDEHPPRFECPAAAVARVTALVDAGDHTLVLAAVEEAEAPGPVDSLLVWKERQFVRVGAA
jgi:flavin reductase (DIM6/NTAB) family NADH-FMN oxidoreductase RutF